MKSLAIISIVLLGCTPQQSEQTSSKAHATLDAIAVAESRDAAHLRELNAEVSDLRREARAVADTYRRAGASHAHNQRTSEEARLIATRASASFRRAESAYARADAQYQLTSKMLMLTLVADALTNVVCANSASTHDYRDELRAQGEQLDGRDVDHVWPHSLGGADNKLNYQMLDSSLNRSLGDGLAMKLQTEPGALIQGALVSLISGIRCR